MDGGFQINLHTHLIQQRVGRLCCPGTEWEPLRKRSSRVTHWEMLFHTHPSLLSHCGLILASRVEIGVHELISTKEESACGA